MICFLLCTSQGNLYQFGEPASSLCWISHGCETSLKLEISELVMIQAKWLELQRMRAVWFLVCDPNVACCIILCYSLLRDFQALIFKWVLKDADPVLSSVSTSGDPCLLWVFFPFLGRIFSSPLDLEIIATRLDDFRIEQPELLTGSQVWVLIHFCKMLLISMGKLE